PSTRRSPRPKSRWKWCSRGSRVARMERQRHPGTEIPQAEALPRFGHPRTSLRSMRATIAWPPRYPPLPRHRGLDQPHPIGRAPRDHVVVEVVARVMQPGGVAIADEDEGAGARLQHVGEVL